MKTIKSKSFKFLAMILAFAIMSFSVPDVFAALCPHLVGSEFNGDLQYCYTDTYSGGITVGLYKGDYSRAQSYCVYKDKGGYGRPASGKTHKIARAQADLC